MIDSSDYTSPADAGALMDYAVLKPPEECAKWAVKQVQEIKHQRTTTGLADMAIANWNAYHSRDEGQAGWGDGLYATGEAGEKVRLRSGMLRSLVRHSLSMVTSTRPVIDPKATNTDASSLRIVEITRSIADHYLRGKKKLYRAIHKAVEHALVLTAGFVVFDWDGLAGDVYDTVPADIAKDIPSRPAAPLEVTDEAGITTSTPMVNVFVGDAVFDTPDLFDVFWDQNAKADDEIDWKIIRRDRNRYDLMARHPEYAEAIRGAKGSTQPGMPYDRLPQPHSESSAPSESMVEVWTLYHRKTLSVPEGRRLVYLDGNTPLEDGPLEFTRLPIIRIAPEDILGTSHGFSPVNLLRPLEEMINKIVSALATNQSAFLVPQILIDAESGIEAAETTGGLGCISVQGLRESPNDPVRLLKLDSAKKEAFDFFSLLRGLGVSAQGLNEVALGNPPPGLNAGVAINLFQSMAYQAASSLERSYAEAVEDSIMLIVEALRAHPDIERMVEIVGKSKRTSLGRFYGKDLHVIDRIAVEMGNPMSRTVAGRQGILQALREQGIQLSPEQAIGVLNTGNLEQATEGLSDEILLIHDENEQIAAAKFMPTAPPPDSGIPYVSLPLPTPPPPPGAPIPPPPPPPPAPFLWGVPPVRAGDNHPLHLQEHRAVGADLALRSNPAVAMALDIHEGWHVEMHMKGDIILGIATGQILAGAGVAPMMGAPPGAPGAPAPHGAPPARPPQQGGPAPRHAPASKAAPSMEQALRPPPLPPVHMDAGA